MLQARQLTACSLRCQHHVQHSSAVLVRPSAAFRPAQTQSPYARPAITPQGASSACSAATGRVTSSIRSSRAASMVCRDAPRPMWAAKQPPESPKADGGAMARLITSNISGCNTVVALSDVYNEWGGSFNHIHASAALARCGKLPGGWRSHLVDKLCSTWLTQLPHSDMQGCANVLWACVRLGPGAVERLWGPTWEAFIEHVQQESAVEGACVPQQLANPLWACAKLRKQLSARELQLMMQTFLQLLLVRDANPQELSNFVWALGELCQLPGWKGGVNEQDVQQLLGKQQLQVVAAGDPQAAANVLVGVTRMATGTAPVISVGFARDCCKQLLTVAGQQLLSSSPQHISNAIWACGVLELAGTHFVAAAVATAPRWVPHSNSLNVRQAAAACAALRVGDEACVQALLQQGLHLLEQQQPHSKGRSSSPKPLSPADADQQAAVCCISVARLGLQPLAGPARELVLRSGTGQRPNTHPGNLSKLWVFHSWLLQHQLLDGKGLAGVLTQQQLQRGAKGAAAIGLS